MEEQTLLPFWYMIKLIKVEVGRLIQVQDIFPKI